MRRLIMWICLHRMRRKHGTRSHLICSRSSWIHHDLDKWRSISETFLSLFTCQSGHTWSFLVIFGHFWSIHFGLIWTFWTGLTRFYAFIYLQHIHYYVTVLNEQYLRVSSNQFFVEMFRHNHHKQKASPLDVFSYVLSSLTIVKMICHRFCNCVVFRLKYMVKLYRGSRIRLHYDALWFKICPVKLFMAWEHSHYDWFKYCLNRLES